MSTKVRWDGWVRDYQSMTMIDTGVSLNEFEQDVELELQRRGHAAPGEGQRIEAWNGVRYSTPWVTTFVGWNATSADVQRGVVAVCDEIEEML